MGLKIFIALLLLAAPVAAQTGGRPSTQPTITPSRADNPLGSIRGRVVLPSGQPLSQAVKVSVQTNLNGNAFPIFTDNQGQFEFRNLQPGEYTIEVEGDRLRYEVTSERVQVFRSAPSFVTIALKEKSDSGGARPAGDVISVGEFDKNVPDKARKEFERASKFANEGKSLEAIEHLRKAIEIYPDFMMAHNDLGAQLLGQGKLEEATAEFRRAIELDAKAFNPYVNLGIILVGQKRFAEAADALRKALSLTSNAPNAKLYMGLALMGLSDLEGAERELKAAHELGGTSYSLALFYLGEVYLNRGERASARQALEAFLRESPDAEQAAQARKLIGQLQ